MGFLWPKIHLLSNKHQKLSVSTNTVYVVKSKPSSNGELLYKPNQSSIMNVNTVSCSNFCLRAVLKWTVRIQRIRNQNRCSRNQGYWLFVSMHFSSLSKLGAYITQNATRQVQDCSVLMLVAANVASKC